VLAFRARFSNVLFSFRRFASGCSILPFTGAAWIGINHSSRSYLDDYYFQREMTTADLLLFSYLEEDRWFACSRFFAEDGFLVGWWLLCYRVAPQQLLFKNP